MAEKWYFKWENNNRTKREPAALIAKYGFKYYGIYAAAREIISQFGGAAPIEVVTSQLGITAQDLEPLFVTGCYHFVTGLLYDPTIEKSAIKRDEISKKRSEAGKKAMQNRWNKQRAKSTVSTGSGKIEDGPEFEFTQDDPPDAQGKKPPDPPDNNCYDISNSNSNSNNLNFVILTNNKRGPGPKPKKKTVEKTLTVLAENIYNEWFKLQSNGAEPMFSVADRTAQKKIIEHLADQARKSGLYQDDEIHDQALAAWRIILNNRRFWGKFETEKIKLTQILSNFSNIIVNIKENGSKGNIKQSINGHSQNGTQSRVKESIDAIDRAQI